MLLRLMLGAVVAASLPSPRAAGATTLPPGPVPTAAPSTTVADQATTSTTSTSSGPTTSTTQFRRSAVASVPISRDPGVPIIDVTSADGPLVARAQADVDAATRHLASAEQALNAAQAGLSSASDRLDAAVARMAALGLDQRQAAAAVEAAQVRLKDLAVAAYVSGGPGGPLAALLSSDTIGDYARRRAVYTTLANRRLDALRAYVRAREEADAATLRSVDAVATLTSAKATADEQVAADRLAVSQARTTLAARHTTLTLITDAATAPGTDIPGLVLDAYRQAATKAQAQRCTLEWWALAGIGKVESNHGRLQHAQLSATGDLLPPIMGIPLDGTGDTARVTSATGTVVAAQGPMQFIPSTWAVAGRDGNEDGKADINNIYDAALAAAGYLCLSSTELTTDAGLRVAYLSYNHSDDYVAEVLAYARAYQAADVSGRLPPPDPVPRYRLAPTTTVTTPSSAAQSSGAVATSAPHG